MTLNFLEIKTLTLGNYESIIDNNPLKAGEGYFTQGSTADIASRGLTDEEHAVSEKIRKMLPDDYQGNPTQTHGNNKGFVYEDTIDPPSKGDT